MTPAQFYAIESQNQQNKMQRMDDLANQVGSGAGRLASAAVGFAAGGPAGAAMAMQEGEGGGGLFGNIINLYTKKEQDKSDAKIYGSLMKVIAPAFGKDGDGILQTFNSFENDSERAEFGRTIAGSLGVIGNMYGQTNRMGLQQSGQQIQAGMPAQRAQINAAAQVAAGQGRMTTLPSSINPDVIP